MSVIRYRCHPLMFALAAALATPATAAEQPSPPAVNASARLPASFIVSDIRVDGLQRIGAGTIFTYLPIERGDTVDAARIAEAMRALYKTGFFEDIRFDREVPDPAHAILVVTVVERPSVNTLV